MNSVVAFLLPILVNLGFLVCFDARKKKKKDWIYTLTNLNNSYFRILVGGIEKQPLLLFLKFILKIVTRLNYSREMLVPMHCNRFQLSIQNLSLIKV